jgi:hypothetical protein
MSGFADSVTTPEVIGSPGQMLYHYTSLDTALQHIVPAQKIRLGPFSSMRDPRESADWSISVGGFVGDVDPRDDIRDFWQFNRRVNELKSQVKVLSLTEDAAREGDATTIAFGRGYAHPRLWEQYADNHRGVCLCFHRELLHRRLRESLEPYGSELHCGPVIYEDREIAPEALYTLVEKLRTEGPIDAASSHLREHINELFFTKLRDWETEREYRFVIQTNEPDPIIARVSTSLRAVILGADPGSRYYEAALAKFCDPAEVEIFHMRWNHGFPHLAPRYEPAAEGG